MWTSDPEDDEWLLKPFSSWSKTTRVSVYGYESATSHSNVFVRDGLHAEAIKLLEALVKLSRQERTSIIFIGHDIGGTIVKEVRE